MKTTEIKSLIPYLMGSIFIGMGTTAMCFLMPNGQVIKIFINTPNKEKLFYAFDDINKHFEITNLISNDTYIGPDELLLKNNKCVAYIYDYIPGKNLRAISPNTLIFDLIENFDTVIENTKKISEAKFCLEDMHAKNIIFTKEKNLRFIDLDNGEINEKLSVEKIFRSNLYIIKNTIIYSLFDVPILTHTMYFYNQDLQNLYNKALSDNDYMNFFLKELSFQTQKNPTKKNIKKLSLIHSKYDEYKNKQLF